MNFLDFSLAELRFRITAPQDFPALCAPAEYAAFLNPSTESSPVALYHAQFSRAIPSLQPREGIFWDNGIWRTRMAHGVDLLHIDIFDIQVNGWRLAASVSPDFSAGELLSPEPTAHASTIRPLYHPQDRAVILGRICHVGGIMMHSSSVLVEGKVLIFAGMSGAGKTTLARLWRDHGAIILNDERNLIHSRDGIVRAGASPWHGEESEINAATGPLAGIFFLKQAHSNQLRPMSLTESLGRMMTTAFIPVYMPGGPARTLDACVAVLERVPAYELSFTPEVKALDLCRSVL